jgi:hypothetical protein
VMPPTISVFMVSVPSKVWIASRSAMCQATWSRAGPRCRPACPARRCRWPAPCYSAGQYHESRRRLCRYQILG